MERVLSIDVGTTNMGLCLLALDRTTTSSTYPFTIVHWELINLKSTLSANMATQNMVQAFLARRNRGIYNVDAIVVESQEFSIETMKRLANGIQV